MHLVNVKNNMMSLNFNQTLRLSKHKIYKKYWVVEKSYKFIFIGNANRII